MWPCFPYLPLSFWLVGLLGACSSPRQIHGWMMGIHKGRRCSWGSALSFYCCLIGLQSVCVHPVSKCTAQFSAANIKICTNIESPVRFRSPHYRAGIKLPTSVLCFCLFCMLGVEPRLCACKYSITEPLPSPGPEFFRGGTGWSGVGTSESP